MKKDKIELEKNIKKLFKKIQILLAIVLNIFILIVIYSITPEITNTIKNCADWITKLDSISITRFIEILLATSFPLAEIIVLMKEGKKENDRKM